MANKGDAVLKPSQERKEEQERSKQGDEEEQPQQKERETPERQPVVAVDAMLSCPVGGSFAGRADGGRGQAARFDDVRAELAELLAQEMQQIAKLLKEESAKQLTQLHIMRRFICLRLRDRPSGSRQPVDRSQSQGAGDGGESSDSLVEDGAGSGLATTEDVDVDATSATDSGVSSEGGCEPPHPPSGRPPSGRTLRQPLPCRRLLPVVCSQQGPTPRPSPRREQFSPTTNESGIERKESEPRRGAGSTLWEERMTQNSGFSGRQNPQSLNEIDDALTDSLFQIHGLISPTTTLVNRVSFGSDKQRMSFGSERQRAASAAKATSPAASVRNLFWKSSGSSAAQVAAADDDVGEISAAQAATIGKGARPGKLLLKFSMQQGTSWEDEVLSTPPSERVSKEHSASGESYYNSGGSFPRRSRSFISGAADTLGRWGTLAASMRHGRHDAAAPHSRPKTMDSLRMERESSLIAQQMPQVRPMGGTVTDHDAQIRLRDAKWSFSGVALAASGIVPLGPGKLWRLYSYATLLTVAGLLAFIVYMARNVVGGARHLYFPLCLGCVGTGAFAATLLLRAHGLQDLLGPRRQPLEYYAVVFSYIEKWHTMSGRCLRVVGGLWLCSTLSQMIMNLYLGCAEAGDTSFLACAVNACITAVLCAVFYCKLHVCCGMELAVDHYCMRFFDDGDLVTGILEWNILQALLRRAAQVVETCFLSVSTGVLGLVVLSSVQIFNIFGDANAPGLGGLSAREGVCLGLWSTWVLPQVVLVFYFVFRAAAITEKCSRVPSLINSSMCQGAEIDHEKQYIVQYISQSAAGFYVKGVRLNATWALKLLYLFGVLIFSLFTQAVLKAQ